MVAGFQEQCPSFGKSELLVFGLGAHQSEPTQTKEGEAKPPHLSGGGIKEFAATFNTLWGAGEITSGPYLPSDCPLSWIPFLNPQASVFGLLAFYLCTLPHGVPTMFSVKIPPQILADACLGATFSLPIGFPHSHPRAPQSDYSSGRSILSPLLPQIISLFHTSLFPDSTPN